MIFENDLKNYCTYDENYREKLMGLGLWRHELAWRQESTILGYHTKMLFTLKASPSIYLRKINQT